MKYSALSIARQALKGDKHWPRVWRKVEPRDSYDAIIIGGGGHGLATAYYLAKKHNIKRIALLEKGWLGGGNVGRNTTIIRSNYMLEGNQPFYEHSVKLWEGLSQDLNYNVMFSQRGILNLYHTDAQRDMYARRGNSMILHGADAHLLDQNGVRKLAPMLDFENGRFPVQGALYQPRAGTARHDAVAWGYARGADMGGVDLIQNCEVTGINVTNGIVQGVETNLGYISAEKVGVAVAGNTTRIADMAGLNMPIESHVLQAFVSEGLKPFIDTVVTYGAGHFYISQSDKGGLVFGGDIDSYMSYAQRGNMPTVEHVIEGGVTLMPRLKRLRVLRSWGGIMDMTPDGSPIIDKSSVQGLYFNCGWCYGGFKATPASGDCFAHLIANDESHVVAKDMRFDRFEKGRVLDEGGRGPHPNLH